MAEHGVPTQTAVEVHVQAALAHPAVMVAVMVAAEPMIILSLAGLVVRQAAEAAEVQQGRAVQAE